MTLTESRAETDGELVAAAREGRREAFAVLVERYRGFVIAKAFSVAASLDAAEDMAQEVFLAAYRSLGSLRNPESFRAWLAAIASHHVAEFLRAVRPAEVHLPDGIAARVSTRDAVDDGGLLDALADLPEKFRVPIVMKHMDGLEYSEVAHRLGLSEAATRQRVHRGLDHLRRRLRGVERP